MDVQDRKSFLLVVKSGWANFPFLCRVSKIVGGHKAGGTGGARVALALPVFWRHCTIIRHKFCLFAWLLGVVNPLILVPRADPVIASPAPTPLIDYVVIHYM